MTGPGAREAGDANRLGGNRRRGPVITARRCHALGCRVLGLGVYLSYSSPSPLPSPLQNENWVRSSPLIISYILILNNGGVGTLLVLSKMPGEP